MTSSSRAGERHVLSRRKARGANDSRDTAGIEQTVVRMKLEAHGGRHFFPGAGENERCL